MAPRRSKSQLQAQLTQHQQLLRSAGLNGTTEKARTDLAEAIARGLDLTEFAQLVDHLNVTTDVGAATPAPTTQNEFHSVESMELSLHHRFFTASCLDERVQVRQELEDFIRIYPQRRSNELVVAVLGPVADLPAPPTTDGVAADPAPTTGELEEPETPADPLPTFSVKQITTLLNKAQRELQQNGKPEQSQESLARLLEAAAARNQMRDSWADLVAYANANPAEAEQPEPATPEADPTPEAVAPEAALPADWDGVLSVSEAERHLRLAGISDDDPVILTIYGGGTGSRFYPDPSEFWTAEQLETTPSDLIPWDWGRVMEWHQNRRAEGIGRPWDEVRRALRDPKNKRASLGYIVNPGGTCTRKRGCEILEVRSITCESDSGDFTAEQKAEAWRTAGLPEPSALMDTGNKSVHLVFRLAAPLTVAEGEHLAKRLNATLTERTGMPMDTSLESACSVYRLAGGRHPKTKQMARLIGTSDQPCDVAALEPLLVEVARKVREASSPEFAHREPGQDGKPDRFELLCPLPLQLPDGEGFPLIEALGPFRQKVVRNGLISTSVTPQDPSDIEWKAEVEEHYAAKGMRKPPGRFVTAWSLSCSLQAAELQLQEMGVPYTGSARELFHGYGEACIPPLSPTDIAGNWEQSDNLGESDKSELYLHRQVSRWAKRNGFWKPNDELLRRAKAEAAKREQRDWQQFVDWRVTAVLTAEKVIEEALRLRAEIESAPLTCYQGRLLRYAPEHGYFQHVKANTLKREIAGMLPKVNILKKVDREGVEHTSHKYSTEAKATACVKWLSTVLYAEEMDVVPAVAFTNGTFLIAKEQLVPHSADHRLTWAIQGDYIAGLDCPPVFREFVASSFGLEWLDVIRRVLRYLVDPTFKPSKLVMILGRSGSGKGTLERLIEAMFPPSCISVITSGFADINHPDKIRQFVRGKRLVAFPDLQGRQVGVGTLYSMTDGGLLTSRTLHESDADEGEAFTGRVVICSTQPPAMEDAGTGLPRRMLVLRTRDVPDRIPDVDLDDKLKAELGEIVSWALQADRHAVKQMLAVGDEAGLLQEAQLEAEVRMDAVRSFIDTCLTPGPADQLVIPDREQLFTVFRLFCRDRNFKAMAQGNFINRLSNALPHLHCSRRAVPGTNSTHKVSAFFHGFQLAQGLLLPDAVSCTQVPMNDQVTFRDSTVALDRRAFGEGGLGLLRHHRPVEPDLAKVWDLQNP